MIMRDFSKNLHYEAWLSDHREMFNLSSLFLTEVWFSALL